MKTKLTKQTCATALSALALAAFLIPTMAQAGPHGGRMPVVAVDDRGATTADDDRGRGRGRDDAAKHDTNDDRGVRRAGADDPAKHDAGDDNDNNRRRGRGN